MAIGIRDKQLTFLDENNHENAVVIDAVPDTCPVCSHGIKPIFVTAYGYKQGWSYESQYYVQTVFRCPIDTCQRLFLSIYKGVRQAGYHGTSDYVFYKGSGFIPRDIKFPEFDEAVERMSPRFIDIYCQTSLAEDGGLKELIGAGYRKSLEVLIKDYLILIKPDISDEIKSRTLGFTIFNYIDNENIKNMAGLAKDIGNDETHYVKKMEELSVEDLKKLIKLTTHWIVTELLTSNYSQIYKKLVQAKEK